MVKLEKAPPLIIRILHFPWSKISRLLQEMPTNELFIPEITSSHIKKYLKDGKLDINLNKTFSCPMPDNKYWKVGGEAGKGEHW